MNNIGIILLTMAEEWFGVNGRPGGEPHSPEHCRCEDCRLRRLVRKVRDEQGNADEQ